MELLGRSNRLCEFSAVVFEFDFHEAEMLACLLGRIRIKTYWGAGSAKASAGQRSASPTIAN